MVQSNAGFMYLKNKFPRISDAKIREGVFDYYQFWGGNHKLEIYRDMVADFVQSYQAMGCNMSLKVHFLDTHLGRPRTTDFSLCDYRAAQTKHTVVYGSANTGDCLIAATKKSQHVPFQERHDCRLTTACTNETYK
jgi:hypothetical protein